MPLPSDPRARSTEPHTERVSVLGRANRSVGASTPLGPGAEALATEAFPTGGAPEWSEFGSEEAATQALPAGYAPASQSYAEDGPADFYAGDGPEFYTDEAAATEAFPAGGAPEGPEFYTDEVAATEAFPAGGAPEWSEFGSEEAATQALPAGYAPASSQFYSDEPATQAMPTGFAERSATRVLPAAARASGGYAASPSGYATNTPAHTATPSPAPQAYYQPAAQPAPQPVAQPMPQPRPAEPQRLPRDKRVMRQRTAALPIGTFLLIASVALLGWGVYTFLTSIHVFEIITEGSQVVYWPAAIAAGVGAVLAFFAVIAAFVAVSRARPKTAAWALLLGAFFLPLASTLAAGYYGGTILKDRTMAEAQEFAGQVDTTQVEEILNELEAKGVPVPWRDDVLEILRTINGEDAQ